jgi:single-stranded-DNA-specific exonuclease
MLWTHTPLPAAEVEDLSKRAGVGPVLAELLLRAGHRDPALAAQFLRADLSGLEDPFLVGNLTQAVARLRGAILAREKVTVLGDYDVDGVSSTALLVLILRRFGLNPSFVVPRRS